MSMERIPLSLLESPETSQKKSQGAGVIGTATMAGLQKWELSKGLSQAKGPQQTDTLKS